MKVENFKNKKAVYIIGGVIAIVAGIIVCVIMELNENQGTQYNPIEVNKQTQENESQNEMVTPRIIVHIAGEVTNPGIVEADEGSRVIDIVKLAGGFTEEANVDKVNLAYEVMDEQKIVIPNKNNNREEPINIIDEDESFIVSTENTKAKKLNINKATQSEFETLTGVGPSMASKILEYRNKNGKFKSIEELKNIPGIGDAKYEALRDEVCVK